MHEIQSRYFIIFLFVNYLYENILASIFYISKFSTPLYPVSSTTIFNKTRLCSIWPTAAGIICIHILCLIIFILQIFIFILFIFMTFKVWFPLKKFVFVLFWVLNFKARAEIDVRFNMFLFFFLVMSFLFESRFYSQ